MLKVLKLWRDANRQLGAMLPGELGNWTLMRDLNAVPGQSFRDWWRERAATEPKKEDRP